MRRLNYLETLFVCHKTEIALSCYEFFENIFSLCLLSNVTSYPSKLLDPAILYVLEQAPLKTSCKTQCS